MNYVVIITSVIIAFALGFIARYIIARIKLNSAEIATQKLLSDARERAESERKELLTEARNQIQKERTSFELDTKERRSELQKFENRVLQRETSIEKKLQSIDNKEQNIESRTRKIKEQESKLASMVDLQHKEIERISNLTREQARDMLISVAEEDAKKIAARTVDNIEKNAIETGEKRAREIIIQTIHRLGSEVTQDISVASVALPSEEMKGRIIGREGRNIRMLETLTGVDIIIDDTPEAVVVSCFDPVRKHIAKISLEKLIMDGRIHPARIEEIVERTKREVDEGILEAGESALADLNMPGMHHELVRYLGRLKYRTSYGQNVLMHSKEVANIAAMIASELGANVALAKRGAFLHDLGKALDVDHEESHAIAGADMAKRYGERDEIVNAIRAHHGDVEIQSIEAVIVKAADAISAARPGARRESFESYVKRLDNLEKIADSFGGVEKSFAIQAGRELRVIARSDIVDDIKAKQMARDIAKRIEDELKYPGIVRVTVIRETRIVEVAR